MSTIVIFPMHKPVREMHFPLNSVIQMFPRQEQRKIVIKAKEFLVKWVQRPSKTGWKIFLFIKSVITR
jgi:hypothetical protein